ncbi:hypothetical protein [Prosthecodimorpha staleyi]|nr:hypothetical protein [Prosthecodimorpha staleyi]
MRWLSLGLPAPLRIHIGPRWARDADEHPQVGQELFRGRVTLPAGGTRELSGLLKPEIFSKPQRLDIDVMRIDRKQSVVNYAGCAALPDRGSLPNS